MEREGMQKRMQTALRAKVLLSGNKSRRERAVLFIDKTTRRQTGESPGLATNIPKTRKIVSAVFGLRLTEDMAT